MSEVADIFPEGHTYAWVSALVVYGLGVVGYLGFFARAVLGGIRWSRRAKLADASVDPERPLLAGEAVVVGVVEEWPDASPAVSVEVEQHGTERETSGSWSHVWTEKNRRMHVRPFYLRLASGERILVEPVREALLLDALDGLVQLGSTRRVRIAELTPGETVIVTGVLEQRLRVGHAGDSVGYRDGGMGWVLKPPALEQMVLSTEPLGARFMNRAHWNAVAALAIALMFCGVHAALLGYHLRVWRGETLVGVVTQHRHYTTEDDDTTDHHYVVTVAAAGDVVTEEVYGSGFRSTSLQRRAAVRSVPSATWASTVGATPTANVWLLLSVVIAIGVVLLVARVAAPAHWQHSTVTDVGSGRLLGGPSALPKSDLDEMAEPVSSERDRDER